MSVCPLLAPFIWLSLWFGPLAGLERWSLSQADRDMRSALTCVLDCWQARWKFLVLLPLPHIFIQIDAFDLCSVKDVKRLAMWSLKPPQTSDTWHHPKPQLFPEPDKVKVHRKKLETRASILFACNMPRPRSTGKGQGLINVVTQTTQRCARAGVARPREREKAPPATWSLRSRAGRASQARAHSCSRQASSGMPIWMWASP